MDKELGEKVYRAQILRNNICFSEKDIERLERGDIIAGLSLGEDGGHGPSIDFSSNLHAKEASVLMTDTIIPFLKEKIQDYTKELNEIIK